MKIKFLQFTTVLLALLAGSRMAVAQGTAFTYQGQLIDGGLPANGDYDLVFTLFATSSGGSPLGGPLTNSATAVSNGLFTSTLDFGANFPGAARWLEVGVQKSGGGVYATLSPRQALTPTPYAIYAAGANAAGLSGTIAAASLANGSITSAKLTAGTITSNQLAAGTVSAANLGPDVGLWSVNGGNVSRSNGNVGIGTTTPGNRLSVAGAADFSGNLGIGVTNPSAALHVNGAVKLNGANTLEFGAGVAGKEPNAGKIGYQAFGPGALDIVGAGTNGPSRQIRFWAEGGAQFMGAVNAPSASIPTLAGNVSISGNVTSSGSISAASATIPTLNGNVSVMGNLGSSGVLSASAATIPILNGDTTMNGNLGLSGTLSAPSATIPSLGGNVAVSGTLASSGVQVSGANILELGAGVVGKEPSAGKIGYEAFGPGALDIVGAGTNPTNRQIRFWAEGGAQFAGAVNAPSASIPMFTGNVTVNGEMTANVVTVTGGSDVAEPYRVAGVADVEPVAGMVVSIDPGKIGQMQVAAHAYDKTVAGILSGANGIAPGITLRQTGTIADGTLPVASIGRVWCYCDADANGAIEAGDMLTTSDTPGHAMKVVEFDRANGSVVGKAMSPLKSGRGLVLVFVSLK
jgi:hypothetical protein